MVGNKTLMDFGESLCRFGFTALVAAMVMMPGPNFIIAILAGFLLGFEYELRDKRYGR